MQKAKAKLRLFIEYTGDEGCLGGDEGEGKCRKLRQNSVSSSNTPEMKDVLAEMKEKENAES